MCAPKSEAVMWGFHRLLPLAIMALGSVTTSMVGMEDVTAGDGAGGSIQAGITVTVHAETEDGHIITECYLYVDQDQQWCSFFTGDPVSLKYPLPLSEEPVAEQLQRTCDEGVDPDAAAAISFCSALLRHPDATARCPYPLYPADNLYMAELANGAQAFLRLPADVEPYRTQVRCDAETADMHSVSAEQIAAILMAGEAIEVNNYLFEDRVCLQQCLNVVAFSEQEGELEALVASAELTTRMCDLYYERNGMYPYQLCQLYTGENAICGGYLSNPYQIGLNLCLSNLAEPRPEGAIRYIPEVVEDGENLQVVGYWLAVLGAGEAVDPEVPLPSEAGYPLRAIKWYEIHD